MNDTNNDDDLLAPREAAHLLGVDTKTVGRWARDGLIASMRTVGGHRRYRRRDVQRLAPDPSRPPAWIDEAVRLYQQGATVTQVAARIRIPYRHMRRVLLQHTTLRS